MHIQKILASTLPCSRSVVGYTSDRKRQDSICLFLIKIFIGVWKQLFFGVVQYKKGRYHYDGACYTDCKGKTKYS